MRPVTIVPLLAVLVLHPHPSSAKGNNAGDLGPGGRVKGDISRDAGETDRITLALDAGAALTIRFSSSFPAHFAVTGPDGAPADLGLQDGDHVTVTDRPVDTGGSYEIDVTSADGSQGVYALSVKEKWARTFTTSGAGRQIVDVAMPAHGKLGCIVHAAAGAAGNPEIVALEDPSDGALLTAPIVAAHGAAKLPATVAPVAGVYHLTVDATDETSGWTATVRRAVPAPAKTSLDLRNGIDQVSFRNDGVGAIFTHRCAQCHGFATTYGGVRGNLTKILARVDERSMPPGGGLTDREVALIYSWVRTGKAH